MHARELWSNPPPPLRGAEQGSWAHHSIVERLPDIAWRTIKENDFPDKVVDQIKVLIQEIPEGPIRPFEDPGAPDSDHWNAYIKEHLDSNWLEAPWFFVETYFYRRLVAITGYFHEGDERWRDPFRHQKRTSLKAAAAGFRPPPEGAGLDEYWLAAVWGNQADLSLWPKQDAGENAASPTPAEDRILVDDRTAVNQRLGPPGTETARVDLILDNAKDELMADLALAGHLLQRHPGVVVHLHCKAHPTFVSDATKEDALVTIHHLADDGDGTVQSLGRQLLSALGSGELLLKAPLFWTSPLAGWQMPTELQEDLTTSQLLIFKGDANYRRLLGDRHWPFTTPFEKVVGYLPASALALRALKADVAAGLSEGAVQRASQQDEDWMINGNWALLQFYAMN